MPESPRRYVDLNQIDHGVLFKGSKGSLAAGFGDRIIIPEGDMTYYEPRSEKEVLEPMGNFQQEWLDACKGDLKTSCDLDYSGAMMEQLTLGLVSYRAGERIEYDGKKGRVTNSQKANSLLSRTYRDGWILNG